MKVVILAAGKGMRLGQGNQSKPLTCLLTGQSILEYQLSVISRYVSLDDVIVVVGYRKEDLMDSFPDLMFVYNSDYASENTSKSLLRALNKCHEDVLWINGDVIFHHSVLGAVLKNPRTSMVVNVGAVGEEEVKYRQESNGRILVVSKDVKDSEGEALGINYCAQADLDLFRRNLDVCDPNDYFEKGLELCIEQGMAVWTVRVDSSLCTEIDFPEDLIRANNMVKNWNQVL